MKKNSKKGFTLVEIIIVIALLVVIAGIFSLNMIKSLSKQKVEENENVVSQILSAANTYVSVNPEEVENLYNGYGYVDIPIGDLRDAGLLSEELKDSETGEIIPDTDKVRVKLDLGDFLDFTYPADGDQDAWKFIADNKNIPYDENGSVEKWCAVNTDNLMGSNVYEDLIIDPTSDYSTKKSKLYIVDKEAKMYTGGLNGYFNEFKLKVDSCDVNPSKVGTYTITYKYTDPKLDVEKTVKRTVYVESANKDVISFGVEINGGTPIVRGTRPDVIPIKIVETYRDGSREIETVIGKLGIPGIEYEIADFDTSKVITKDATVNRTKKNSDGSLPVTQKTRYQVIPDEYKLTYDIGYTLNRRESSFPDRVKKYNNDIAMLKTKKTVKFQYSYVAGANNITYAKPSGTYGNYGGNLVNVTDFACSGSNLCRRGYTFDGWYIQPTTCMTTYAYPEATLTKSVSIGNTKIYNNTMMSNLCNHTVKAKWIPNKYTVFFNLNGSYNDLGSSLSPTSKIVTYDETYGTLPTPTRVGYTFLGWFTSATGGTQITASTEVDIIANQNLYAHWKANNYTVSYNTGGSKIVTFDSPYGPLRSATPPSGSSRTYTCNGDCTCQTVTYYTFDGWSLNGQYISSGTIVRTPYNHTLSAIFTRHSYKNGPFCPPPPSPPKPKPNTGSGGSSGGSGGSSGSGGSCTPSCSTDSCSDDHFANANQCQIDWVNNGCQSTNDPGCEELHDIAMSERDEGVTGSDTSSGCTATYCPNSGNTWDPITGTTTSGATGGTISITVPKS